MSVLVTGQIDHAGQLFRAALHWVHVVPDVFVNAQGGDAGEAGLISRCSRQERLDRFPHGPPRGAELPGDPGHRAMLTTDLLHRPPARPDRQHRARFRDGLVLLCEGADRAGRLGTFPGPFPPQHIDWPTETRRIDQPHHPPAVTRSDHPTRRTPHHDRRRFHTHPQTATVVALDPDHVQAVQADQQVTVVAIGIVPVAGPSTTRRLRHSRGP